MCNILYNKNYDTRRRNNETYGKNTKAIIEIVKNFEPITSDEIAEKLSLGKSTLRNDLAVLGMLRNFGSKT